MSIPLLIIVDAVDRIVAYRSVLTGAFIGYLTVICVGPAKVRLGICLLFEIFVRENAEAEISSAAMRSCGNCRKTVTTRRVCRPVGDGGISVRSVGGRTGIAVEAAGRHAMTRLIDAYAHGDIVS
jgi:hypothetical protein